MTFLWLVYLGGVFSDGEHGFWRRMFWPIYLGEWVFENCAVKKMEDDF